MISELKVMDENGASRIRGKVPHKGWISLYSSTSGEEWVRQINRFISLTADQVALFT